MSNAAALSIVQAIYEAFSRRDVPKIFSLFSPEVKIVQAEELPWGGQYHGHTGAQQFFTKLTSQINSTVEIERMLSAGDQIAVVGWTQGTVNATGVKYRVPLVHVWTVQAALVVRVEFMIDTPMMLAALAADAHRTRD